MAQQLPISEQKFVTLPPEMEAPVDDLKSRIANLFAQIEDDDINVARKLWRELNNALIQAFTMGVYDVTCGECGENWAVARRQALSEIHDYRTRAKTCPECGSTRLGLDIDLQMLIRELTRQAAASDGLAPGEAEAAAAAAR